MLLTIYLHNFNTSLQKSLLIFMNFNTSLLKSLLIFMNFNTSLLKSLLPTYIYILLSYLVQKVDLIYILIE